jgi:hypothetical protein
MRLPIIATSVAVLTAVALISTPAFAGQHGHQGGGQHGASAPQSRGSAGHAQQRSQAQAPRQQAQAPVSRSQSYGARPQSYGQRYDGRSNGFVGNAAPRGSYNAQHYAPNYRYAPNYGARYAPNYGGRYYGSRGYGYGYYSPRYYGAGYAFRPRFSLGYGIWAGYPVPYAFDYGYPVPVYGYEQPQTVVVNPGSANANAYGGISFEVTPYEADVYVDGNFAGHVSDFNGGKQPMTLAAGNHRIEIVADGYQTLTFDASVQPGQIIPYRGDMQR